MDFRKNDIVYIKKGVFEYQKDLELTVLSDVIENPNNGQEWIVLHDPREEDPVLFKPAHLELKTRRNYFLITKTSRNAEIQYLMTSERENIESLDLEDIGEVLVRHDGGGSSYGFEISVERIPSSENSLGKRIPHPYYNLFEKKGDKYV